jgi:hypothetical protein
MIIVKVRPDRRRMWEYFLRKKFNSKKKLEILVEYLIMKTVAEEAKKSVEELDKIK